ncbi:MFS transporter, partial [Staphylococcus felis]
ILYLIALISYIYKMTGEAKYSALIPICVTIFLFLSGFVSNYIYLNYGELLTMRISQIFKTIIMVSIIITMSSKFNLLLLLLFVCVNSFLDGLINPIKNSLIPIIEKPKNIILANAKMNVMNNTIQVTAWAVGGILIAVLGNHNVVLLTILTYITSIFFILKIKVNKINNNDNTNDTNIFSEFIGMINFNKKNIHSMYINVITIVESFAHSAWISAILLVFVKEFLNSDIYIFGLINSAFFAGIILGGLVTSKFSSYMEAHYRSILILGSFICSFLNLIFGFSIWIHIILMISFFYGMIDQTKSITMHSIIQLNLEEKSIIKVYTLNNMVYALGFCTGTLFISYISDAINVNTTYLIASISYILSGFISIFYVKN